LTLLAQIQLGRRLRGKVEPGDLVQETFLDAHRHVGRFRGTSNAEFASWLRQILAGRLSHTLRRYLGTRCRDVDLERRLEAELDRTSQSLDRGLVAAESSPSQRAARSERAVLLSEALAELPQEYREVIVLRHLAELTFPEVARRMDRSLDSVEKLWMRALSRLRRTLREAL
jgi:RNA polymerase sigma-70 factor (ECF subfamily)